MNERYWFARHRANPPGRGLVPLRWQGRAVIALFVIAIIGGGILWLLLALLFHLFIVGVIIFALCALAGGAFFIWAAATRSDPVRSVADYRREQGR
jgi:hypothetical protein